MSTMRTKALLAALAAATLLVPATASAADLWYGVEVDATIDYHHAQDDPDDRDGRTGHWTTDVSAQLHAPLTGMLFRDGRVAAIGRGAVQETYAGSATAQERTESPEWGGAYTSSSSCALRPEGNGWGTATLQESDRPVVDGAPQFAVRVTDLMSLAWDCDDGSSGPGNLGDFNKAGGAAVGQGPIDATFYLPKDSIGQGKVIQLLPGPDHPMPCPGRDADTTACSFTWTGTVTFTRSDDEPGPPVEVTETRPPKPTPAPAPLPPLVTSDGDVLAWLVVPRRTLRVRRTARRLRVPMTCVAGCAGTLSLSGTSARHTAAGRPLAHGRLRLAPGQHGTTLRLPRRALRHVRRATLTLTVAPPTGAPVTRTVAVAVR